MIYTVHVGARNDEWPPQVGQTSTREQAQKLALSRLAAAPAAITKAEVRNRARLLDSYGKRPTGVVRHVYVAKQRTITTSTQEDLL